MGSGFAAEGDFGTVDPVDARVAAGGGIGGFDDDAGDETELHETLAEGFGKVEAVEGGGLADAKGSKRHYAASIRQGG